MSKKHFDKYYLDIVRQYSEMLNILQQYEKDMMNNMVEPEFVDNIKETMQPIKDAYMSLAYVNYLLNMPDKKEKAKKYKRQHDKEIVNSKTAEQVKSDNREILDKLSKGI